MFAIKKKFIILLFIEILLIYICILGTKNIVLREVLLRDLKSISTQLMYMDNFYERNKDNKNTIDYGEIHQSWKQINSIIHNMNNDSIDTNTKKVIRCMDITFSKIAPSNKISKDNAYLYYQKINILRDKIRKSLKNVSFKDISDKDCNEILNVLRELEKIFTNTI